MASLVLAACPQQIHAEGSQAVSSRVSGNIHTAGETHRWNTKRMQCAYHVIKTELHSKNKMKSVERSKYE